MNVFFTGCTHFDHDNILTLAGRPFSSVEEMNEELVRRYNSVVGPSDLVYHLGDFGWNGGRLQGWLRRLNGMKVVILGNHDSASQMDDLLRGNLRRDNGTKLISVRDHEFTKPGVWADVGFHLYHYPIDDWCGRWRGSIHLHCHTHARTLRNPSLPVVEDSGLNFGDGATGRPSRFPEWMRCNRFNVGVDACAFAPISLEEILQEARK